MNLDITIVLNKVHNLAKLMTLFKQVSLGAADSRPPDKHGGLEYAGGPFLSPRDGLVLLNRGSDSESSIVKFRHFAFLIETESTLLPISCILKHGKGSMRWHKAGSEEGLVPNRCNSNSISHVPF